MVGRTSGSDNNSFDHIYKLVRVRLGLGRVGSESCRGDGWSEVRQGKIRLFLSVFPKVYSDPMKSEEWLNENAKDPIDD